MAAKTPEVEEAYLAQPASSSCWLGTIHKGTPRGNLETILDVPTYVSTPTPEKANGHIVLYFPDVWGMSNNAKLLMDGFADAGFLTLGMDYFRGVRMNQRGDVIPTRCRVMVLKTSPRYSASQWWSREACAQIIC